MVDSSVRIDSEGPLDGQVALVTGAGSGIGRATAHELAAAGAKVAVVDRDSESAARTAREVGQLGVATEAFVVELSNAGSLAAMVQAILGVFGRIDILVNCAGITAAPHSTLDVPDETLSLVMAVNVLAPFVLIGEVGKHMIWRGGGGRIVNLSSSAAFRATASPAAYATSKAAINGLTRAAAADLGLHDINVNAVAPGITKTPMTAGIGNDDDYQRVVSSGPLENLLHRPSEGEDVAKVILFLCLPESRQMTGQVLHTSAGLVV